MPEGIVRDEWDGAAEVLVRVVVTAEGALDGAAQTDGGAVAWRGGIVVQQLDRAQRADVGARDLPVAEEGHAAREDELEIVVDALLRNAVEPAHHRLAVAAEHPRHPVLKHDADAAIDVVRRQRVLERRLRHPVRLVPRRRTLVELRDLARGGRACEMVLQQRGEEMVIPVPVAHVVERDEKRFAASSCWSIASLSLRWRTASQRGGLRRGRIDVASRNWRTSGGWRSSTSSVR